LLLVYEDEEYGFMRWDAFALWRSIPMSFDGNETT